MFGFVTNIIGSLFGGSGAASKSNDFVETAVKGIGSWIDEQDFTDEEKGVMNLKTGEMMIRAVEATRGENSARSITRRVLAWAIMGTFLAFLIIGAALYRIDPEYSKFMLSVATKSLLGELAIGVGAFYFLANVVRARK